jgi:hypothetical protein
MTDMRQNVRSAVVVVLLLFGLSPTLFLDLALGPSTRKLGPVRRVLADDGIFGCYESSRPVHGSGGPTQRGKTRSEGAIGCQPLRVMRSACKLAEPSNERVGFDSRRGHSQHTLSDTATNAVDVAQRGRSET